mgnify:CR=1 FL=1
MGLTGDAFVFPAGVAVRCSSSEEHIGEGQADCVDHHKVNDNAYDAEYQGIIAGNPLLVAIDKRAGREPAGWPWHGTDGDQHDHESLDIHISPYTSHDCTR